MRLPDVIAEELAEGIEIHLSLSNDGGEDLSKAVDVCIDGGFRGEAVVGHGILQL